MKNRIENDPVWIVMRSMNDRDVIGETLERVRSQRGPRFKLLNIDSGSTDGTLDIISDYTDRLIRIRPEEYIPGRVINTGMSETDTEVVVFLNSDATPVDDHWLENLLREIRGDRVAAVYGRQMSRPDTLPLFHKDNERAFGDGNLAATWTHFFSMANSAVVRSVWEQRPFDEEIRYSEDTEWSYWARKAGFDVRYACEAAVMHSHNYTLAQSYKRHHGEGAADAWIFDFPPGKMKLPRILVSAGVEVMRDFAFCLKTGRPGGLLHSIPLRLTQRIGRYKGYWKEKKKQDEILTKIHI